MYYTTNNEGFIISCGLTPNFGAPAKGDEPFGLMDAFDWRLNVTNGEWVSAITPLIYVIIPTDLIPELVGFANLVQDVLTNETFTIYLDALDVECREGVKTVPTLPVSFTPCTCISWDEATETESSDDEKLQGIIDRFNSLYKPPRKIDFDCKFDSKAEFDQFKINMGV